MRNIVQEGAYIPTKRNAEGILQEKSKTEWSLDEKQRHLLNS